MTLLHQSKKLTGKQVFPQKKKKKRKNPVPGPLPQLKKTSPLAWTYRNLKQKRAYVTKN